MFVKFKVTKKGSRLLRGLTTDKLVYLLLNGDYDGREYTFSSSLMGDLRFDVDQTNKLKTKAKLLGLHLTSFLCYAVHYYSLTDQNGRNKGISEAWFQDRLQRKLGGIREVVIPHIGRIDLLTHDRLIELKYFEGWKGALGQCLCYHRYYPKHKPTLGLINAPLGDQKKLIEEVCSDYGVEIMWLSDDGYGNMVIED